MLRYSYLSSFGFAGHDFSLIFPTEQKEKGANIPTIAARAVKTGVLDFAEIAVGLYEGGSVAQGSPTIK